MKISGVSGYPLDLSLKKEIKCLGQLIAPEKVRELYGQVGLDIFEGRKVKLTDEQEVAPKSLKEKFINFFKKKQPQVRYEEHDSLFTLMHKYIYIHKSGNYSDFDKMFGKRGLEIAKTFEAIGFFKP